MGVFTAAIALAVGQCDQQTSPTNITRYSRTSEGFEGCVPVAVTEESLNDSRTTSYTCEQDKSLDLIELRVSAYDDWAPIQIIYYPPASGVPDEPSDLTNKL